MSRSKVTILSKYVMALAILALLFSVAITTSRYALQQSGSSTIGIESFDVDVKLYDSNGTEITDGIPDVTTEDLASYSGTYYLDVINNDNETLYYKIEESTTNFIFKVDEGETYYSTYAGSVEGSNSTYLTLTVYASPSAKETIPSGEYYKLPIKFYAEYQHGEEYKSVEVEVTEPEPTPEPETGDTNHSSTEWNYLTNENTSGASLDTTGNYCLIEDVELTSSLTISNNVTLCLNGHKLTAASSYSLDQLINVTNGSVIVEDCQEGGYIGGSTSISGISISGTGATLTLTSGEIKDCLYGVNLSNGATFNMSGGSITNATDGVHLVSGTTASISGGSISSCNDGVYQVSGATLKLSGTPVISGNTYGDVYLDSGALITLGELKEGANIGVYTAEYPYWDETTPQLSVQISTNETDTYYYENAINYIHSTRDGAYYKLSRSNNDRCLNLIQNGMINVSVAVKNTPTGSTTTTSPSKFYVNGFSWDGADGSNNILWTTSSYNGYYSYDQYYDFGLVYNNSDQSFSIAPDPFAWSTNLDQSGLAPDDTLATTLTQNNANDARFGLYATQYQGTVGEGWVGAVWYLNMWSNVSDYTTLNSIGDLTLVLEYDGSNLDTSFDSGTNNVVSNVYFITTSGTVTLQ